MQEAIAGGLERRREPVDRTKAIPFPQLDRLWRRNGVAVREKALWRLLYETAARAQEVLSLNVEDVDLENKRARVRSKGGDTEWLHLQSGSARLAYVSHTFPAQGQTVDRAHVIADRLADANGTYVALTRAREHTHLYASTERL